MRRERSFLILVVAGLALGAYIYFVERKRPASDEAPQKPKVFENVKESDVEEIVVASEGQKTHLKKVGEAWQIVEPITADADRDQVNNLLGNFATLERNEVVEEQPKNLKEFGLDPPRSDVAFRTRDAKTFRRLLVGSKAPTSGDLYARVGDEPRVILISGFMEGVFVRSTFDLRDKSILKIDREKIDALEIVTAGGRVKLTHSSTEWRIAEPLQVRADFGTAEGVVGRLATGQMRSLVEEQATDPATLKKYGLDAPAISATVVSGSNRATLQVGTASPDGTFYAKDASRPLVFTIDAGIVDELKKAPADYRRRDVFDFRPFNATRVEVIRNGASTVFARVPTDDKNAPGTTKWRQQSPTARDADLQKMDAFLSGFGNLRIDTWVQDAAGLGLGAPEITIAVSFDEGKKQERVSFIKQGDTVYVTRADEPGAAKLSGTDYATAVRSLDDVLK